MPKRRFKLVSKKWYAWQMIPGYTGVPYYSPIWVQKVKPRKTGKGILQLEFWNVGYAEGLQGFCVDLQVLYRGEDYLVAKLASDDHELDRCAIISPIEFGWLERFCPGLPAQRPPSSFDPPANLSAEDYLNAIFRSASVSANEGAARGKSQTSRSKIDYSFWLSDTRGLIRQRRTKGCTHFPEVWADKHWTTGSAYVMDAITGMGEDPHSCGEWADSLTTAQAEEYARLHNIDLYARNSHDDGN